VAPRYKWRVIILIRPYTASDWPAVWAIIRPIFHAGKTYAFSNITEIQAEDFWVRNVSATFVAVDENDCVLGSYYIKPNQPLLGAHICNAAYVVDESQRGKGVASRMCEHSQEAASRQGFLAMQFNFVVSTNTGAVRLWEKLGFAIVDKIPEAFQSAGGCVDAFIMHKQLQAIES